MGTFAVTVGDAEYQVDAPDENTAWKWANKQHALDLDYAGVGAEKTDRPVAEQRGLPLGIEAFPDAVRAEMQAQPWGMRQYLGAGTALGNIIERAKQIAGREDRANIIGNRVMAQEAPLGAVAGNAALYAPLSMIPAANTIAGAGLTGATIGSWQPADSLEETIRNAAMGSVFSMGGQAIGDELGTMAAQRAAQRAEEARANAPRAETLRAGVEAGLRVPPSSVNPSLKNRLIESMSGKISTAQLASSANQQVGNKLARAAVGLPDDVPLTSEAMQAIRRQAYQAGYVPVARAGKIPTDATYGKALDDVADAYQGAARSFPNAVSDDVTKLVDAHRVGDFDAGDAIKAVQILRDDAAKAFRNGDTGLAKARKDVAKAIEDQIERGLFAKGEDGRELLKGFRDSRKLMAKAHTVEDAIIEGSADVNLRKFGARVQAGKPMSDELEVLGRFANLFPRATQPPTQVAGPDVNNLRAWLGMLTAGSGGGAGAMLGGAPGAAVGSLLGAAAPIAAQTVARSYLFSPSVQKNLLSQGPSFVERLGSPAMQMAIPPAALGLGLGLSSYGAQ